ncbi:hypothetical protein [Oceanobacillus sp. FSL W7-1293]|uniref:hypothetical protein n=1 Tax=unclassified Oceanobacillus TaxID=2630292 RepID=UPI0030CC2991
MVAPLKNITKINAKRLFENLDGNKLIHYKTQSDKSEIAEDLTVIYEKILEEIGSIKNNYYKFDLLLALDLYELLIEKYNVRIRQASNMQMWYALQLIEVPHIVYARWGLNESRFVKTPRRVYFWTLWWYIHISWQGSKEKTYKILKQNNTDTLVQMVERIGRNGYRIELYRKIMYYHDQFRQRSEGRDLIRRVMKLNTIKCKVIEPELYHGGIDQYAADLFKYFK